MKPLAVVLLLALAPIAHAAPHARRPPIKLRYLTLEKMIERFSREAQLRVLATR